MAKRKRLAPIEAPQRPDTGLKGPLETKSMRPPIADVAGDVAASAALVEVTETMRQAREEGRMILRLTLDQIDMDHLVRDRLWSDSEGNEDSAALIHSLRERGQQTPIEVVALGGDRYGLISGWRRCKALRRLSEEGAHDGHVLALLRQQADGPDAYLAMIEENEIRAGLSYFERARIACKTVELGLFESLTEALQTLYASASRARRSKIRSFCVLVDALDGVLRFPTHIGERLGLQLAKALQDDPGLKTRLTNRLQVSLCGTPEEEQTVIQGALRAPRPNKQASKTIAPGLSVQQDGTRLVLSGKALTPELQDELLGWLRTHLA